MNKEENKEEKFSLGAGIAVIVILLLFTLLGVGIGKNWNHSGESNQQVIQQSSPVTFYDGCGKDNPNDCPKTQDFCISDDPSDCPQNGTTTWSVSEETGPDVTAPNGDQVFEVPVPQDGSKSIYATFNPNYCKVTYSKAVGDVSLNFNSDVIGYITCKW